MQKPSCFDKYENLAFERDEAGMLVFRFHTNGALSCSPARRLAVGHELNVDPGEPAQSVLVAFQHHDADIGVITCDVAHGQVDSPASGNPPGNSQARQQRADRAHGSEAGAVGGVHQKLPPGETAEPFPGGWRSGLGDAAGERCGHELVRHRTPPPALRSAASIVSRHTPQTGCTG
jgi:hypothetical protein